MQFNEFKSPRKAKPTQTPAQRRITQLQHLVQRAQAELKAERAAQRVQRANQQREHQRRQQQLQALQAAQAATQTNIKTKTNTAKPKPSAPKPAL